ncbi:MAG TPA: aminotransferase class V-fold PLP-dependent enzyme [Dehalococcoidia bacterium]|nr:aminotransferase class V-fold PLP-dependent enzyme [Dehalococcoidia bacterium]
MPDSAADFARLRDSIRATRNIIYMNTGFSGPSPDAVIDRINEVLEQEATLGPASIGGLAYTRAITGEAQAQVARMLNCDADEVQISHGTTEGVHVVIYGMHWQPGDELVTCNLEHPALATPASVLEDRFGATVHRVELSPTGDSAGSIVERIVSAITPKTKLVALSHVQFSCGLKLPVKEITMAAHERGVPVIFDGAQTGGQLAIDVRDIGCDFYSISGQKWVLGPEATGALYVSRAYHRQLDPIFNTHNVADARPYPGEPAPLQRFRLASQSPALIGGFATALATMQSLGMENVEAYSRHLGDRMREGLSKLSGAMLTSPSAPGLTCGLVSAAFEAWQPQQIVDALWERWKISARTVPNPAGVRFSLAAFNNESDVDQALDALATLTRETPPPVTAPAH